jgi:hypothetical protein
MKSMHAKVFKMRGLTVDQGKKAFVVVNLEFEGERAFVVWDSITLGEYKLKARVEIDPELLQRAGDRGCDFYYLGQLVLPRPEHN